jgi:rhamnosyltransferase
MTPERVAAIVVTYQPDLAQFERTLAALRPQVATTIVVDNGDQSRFVPDAPDIHFLSLGENYGIAKAQNEGIRLAETLNATHVLLMDQDSLPEPDMVAELLRALREKPDAACVGPRFIDDRRREIKPFTKANGFLFRTVHSSPDNPVVKLDTLISSGSLIPMAVFPHVGLLREDLFIDFVDIEWCFRARKAGYACYGVHNAIMRHSMGERIVRFMGKDFMIHSPFRSYYQFRNLILICREREVSSSYKAAAVFNHATKVFLASLLLKDRFRHLKMIVHGIFDGLRGRGGSFDATYPALRKSAQ